MSTTRFQAQLNTVGRIGSPTRSDWKLVTSIGSNHCPGPPRNFGGSVADKAGLKGIVCKQANSRYLSGRAKHWLKAKASEEAEFDLVGVKRKRGKPAMALLARNGEP